MVLKELLLCTVVESGETLYLLTSTKTSSREEYIGKGVVKINKISHGELKKVGRSANLHLKYV